ncbi:MAG: heavy metal translocating P-type ATPase [Pseudomonadota bacterium]
MNSALPKELIQNCYHCGEPIPPGLDFYVEIGEKTHPMCCAGCVAVAQMIAQSGLSEFYEQRSQYNFRPTVNVLPEFDRYRIYDDPALLAQCSAWANEEKQYLDLRLLLSGMSCAACVWLIESHLRSMNGVESAAVNMAQQRLDARIDVSLVKASEIFAHVAALGYDVQPWHVDAQQAQAKKEYRQDLRRLAVAGIGMMQVGMFAIALHAGDIQGIAADYQFLLRIVSLLVSAFVLTFSAQGFFLSAWRHLKRGALVMDLPVALALSLAFCASVFATFSGSGEVYFDSVVMFTFLLLGARFVEKRLRYQDSLLFSDIERTLPDAVLARKGTEWRRIPRKELKSGDRLRVLAGDVVPVDGMVLYGTSEVREDSFNGESLPRSVERGSTVYAGTVNTEGSLELKAIGTYADTRLAALQKSLEHAAYEKPAAAILADRIASRFVATVLLLTGVTALVWYQTRPADAFWIALAVLVISCPCALSIATPAALTNAAAFLRRCGVLVNGENSLETLSRCTHVLFDKTGTLTTGNFALERIEVQSDKLSEEDALAFAAALQAHSRHPLAKAFSSITPASEIENTQYLVGRGLQGNLGAHTLRLGSPAFIQQYVCASVKAPVERMHWIALAIDEALVAWFGLTDELHSSAERTVETLSEAGLRVELLSGDSSARAEDLATRLPFASATLSQSPEQKRVYVASLQQQGAIVLMVGDGLNDAPVLKQADVSIAVAGATDLARAQADFVLSNEDIEQIPTIYAHALRTRSIVCQNFAWALAYNALGIPFAAMGLIAPWLAAIGMSASSLVVVANAARLRRNSVRNSRG